MPTAEAAWLRLGADREVNRARLRTLAAVTAPFSGLLPDLLRSGIRDAEERARERAPLPERLHAVRSGEQARLTMLAHRADLAFLGLLSGWPYPALVDVTLDLP